MRRWRLSRPKPEALRFFFLPNKQIGLQQAGLCVSRRPVFLSFLPASGPCLRHATPVAIALACESSGYGKDPLFVGMTGKLPCSDEPHPALLRPGMATDLVRVPATGAAHLLPVFPTFSVKMIEVIDMDGFFA